MVRYEYLDTTVREKKIHPNEIFSTEQRYAKNFVNAANFRQDIQACPFCDNKREEILFEKWGLQYALCLSDWSVGLAFLPDEDLVRQYFHDSPLAAFRASKEYQDSVTRERNYIWESLIDWIEGRIGRYIGNDQYRVVDWGSKFVGWLEALQKASFIDQFWTSEPLPPIVSGKKDDDTVDVICLIDVIQRQTDPLGLISNVHQNLEPGGILLLTCRSGPGFDILTLREHSESIFPLDHISLPSPKGLKTLLQNAGFEIMELTTPGMLDVSYVKKSIENVAQEQYFQRYFFSQADQHTLERFQGFLQQNNLSSHIRCIAKKR